MDVLSLVEAWGGVTTYAALRRNSSRQRIRAAVEAGALVIDGRGRYSLPHADAGLRGANAASAVLSHRSAAAHWGWEQKGMPKVPDLTLPRNRRPRRHYPPAVLHYAALGPDDVDGLVTTRERTLLDCLRSLPFDESLAIADSALRHGFGHERLISLCLRAHGRGTRVALQVAQQATGEAANPFESVLRALAIQVGLDVTPQHRILLEDSGRYEFVARPDLVDVSRKLVLEADSYAHHGGRRAFAADCRRYNQLTLMGYRVLRFAWEDVMFAPEEVLAALHTACLGSPLGRCR